MRTVVFDNETYKVVMDDIQTLSAVRADGERKVVVLNWNKTTDEIKRRARVCEWLNKQLKEEAK
jgi:hypothetical protein